MENELFYICENVECPGCEFGDSDEVVELQMPLYEDYTFAKGSSSLRMYDLKQFMSFFSCAAERCYISIKRDLIKNNLINVVSTEAYVEGDRAEITYHFEDDKEWSVYADKDLDRFNKTQLKMIVKLAKETAPHLFYVSCELTETNFKFIKESWNEYYDE